MSDFEEKDLSELESNNYSCPSCDAPLIFDPSKSMLHCNYCGLDVSIDGKTSNVEYDFDEDKDVDEKWDAETKVVKCESCGANNVIPSGEISVTCPFCGSNHVVETNELVGIKPHRIIPFKISEEIIKQSFCKWIKGKFFVPGKVKKQIPETKIYGVYVPAWTFDCETYSIYDGKLGKRYTRTVGSGKNRRTVTEIRYFRIRGSKKIFFDDLIISAGKNISSAEIANISPFKTNDSFEYDMKYLAGFSSEHYTLKLKTGWDSAKFKINDNIRSTILHSYNYDVVSYLNVNTTYNSIKYKYVLLPVWIGNYVYHKKIYRFIANGESGRMYGKTPISALKVTLVVLLVIALVVAFMLFAGYSE